MSEKSERIDLGLAVLSALAKRGEPLTYDDIAAWCDCEVQSISNVEAMEKRGRELRDGSG